jgi:ABC-type oligopeptide transport system ATPase subunit
MVPVLEVENLEVHFPIKKGVLARTVGYVKAVDGVSFKLYRGEALGIVGSSGSGKSTVARALTKLVKPTSGKIKTEGRISMIFQDPLGSLNPRQSIGEIIGIQPVKDKIDVAALLKDVGLPAEAANKYPHEFSGGERQRVCIARALAVKPQILICDEAVSALDLSIRSQILELLSAVQKKYNLSVIFITHDLGVVKHICERVLVMSSGKIVEEGLSRALFKAPQNSYTAKLVDSVLRIGS